jgi:hypothetical protein
VTAVADRTVSEMLLLSAVALEEEGHLTFTAEELVVAAWQRFPRPFGLKGFAEQHPDANKVLTGLMGEKGIVRRGWLVKMGQKLYALTRDGRSEAGRLRGDPDAPLPPPPPPREEKLPRELEQTLLGLLESTAVQKYREDRKAELTFADACRFWAIPESLTGSALDARLDSFRATLSDVKRRMGRGSILLSTRQSVSLEEVARLDHLDAHLAQRFDRLLNLLRSRGAKR